MEKKYLPPIIDHYMPHIEAGDYYWISPKYGKSMLLKLCGFMAATSRITQEEKDLALEAIRLLLELGVDPNVQGKEGGYYNVRQFSWAPYKRSYYWGKTGEKLREEFQRYGFYEEPDDL